MTPRFSIVIPTCDRAPQLAECLDRLRPGQQSIDEAYEVVVSDDSRTSETASLVLSQYPWVRWAKGPQRGPAANRNQGAAIAKAAWVVFTDDDCLPERDWLEAYMSAMRRLPEAAAFEGAIVPQDPLMQAGAKCPVNDSGGRFWSANIAVRRDVFQQLDGFSPLFPYNASEDQDLYFRLQEVTAVPFVGDARVIHPVTYPRLRHVLEAMPRMIYSYTLLCLRHPGRTDGGSLLRRWADGIRFHLRVIARSIPRLDWRSVVTSGAYLTLGFVWGCRYHFSLKRSVKPVV